MKSFFKPTFTKILPALAVVSALALYARAADEHAGHDHDHGAAVATPNAAGQLIPVDAKTDAAWLAKARAAYPMETCAVSDEKLGGSMGAAPEFIYREAGKPDQLVRFCCKSCVADFTKDPVKYLKVITDATAAKAKAPAAGK